MLNGDVDIGQNLRGIPNRGDKLVGHAFGLQIQNANPAVVWAHHLSNTREKLG